MLSNAISVGFKSGKLFIYDYIISRLMIKIKMMHANTSIFPEI